MGGEVSVILHVHQDNLRDALYTSLRAWSLVQNGTTLERRNSRQCRGTHQKYYV